MVGHIIDTVKEDHRTIEACYDRIVHASQRDEQIRFQNLFTWELSRNLVGKEVVVYPALETHLADGVTLTNEGRHENHTIKENLKKFQSLDPSNSGFIPSINDLMNHLKERIVDEETNQLPALESALSEKKSVHLSKSYNRTKIFLPTRSHPSTPSRPSFGTAVGLATAPFDQFADMFRKWPQHA